MDKGNKIITAALIIGIAVIISSAFYFKCDEFERYEIEWDKAFIEGVKWANQDMLLNWLNQSMKCEPIYIEFENNVIELVNTAC